VHDVNSFKILFGWKTQFWI